MPRKKEVSREEFLKKKRDAEKKRREKIKSNPELYKEYLEKEKKRYIQRKQTNKLKCIDELTPRSQRIQRKKWKINQENSRKKKKVIRNLLKKDTPPVSGSEDDPVIHRIPAPPLSPDRGAQVSSPPMSSEKLPGPSRVLRQHNLIYKDKSPDTIPGSFRAHSLEPENNARIVKGIRRQNYKLRKQMDYYKTSLLESRMKYQSLLRRIRRMRQTIQQIKSLKTPLTPSTKAEVLISDPDKKEEVKRAIIFKDIVQKNILKTYESQTKTKKIEMKKNIDPIRNDLKKYDLLQELPKLARPSTSKEKDDTRKIQIEKDIKSFYEDDNNSRMTSGKKDCITQHKHKKQKRFLNDNQKNLYKKFLETHDDPVSYSYFCSLRPFWVIAPSEKDRETCKCKLHDNVDLLAKALHEKKIIGEKCSKEIVSISVCDPYSLECLERKCPVCINKGPTVMEFDNSNELTYYLWGPGHKEVNTKCGTTRIKITEKKEHTGKPKEVILILLDLVQKLLIHTANITNQYECTSKLKKEPENNSVVIHMDFSENYSTKYNTEIQSLHFGGSRAQISLHTSVIYISGSSKPVSFCTYSDCVRHDAVAVWGHLIPILDYIENMAPDTDTLHFMTDSTCSQYRNKTMNYIIAKLHWYLPKLKTVTWNFSEAGHGKGAPDGVGATLKRTADQIIRQGKDIPNIDVFSQEMKKAVKNVILKYVSEYDIIEKEYLMPTTSLKPFKGMLQVHQVVWDKQNKNCLALRRQTCINDFCKSNALRCPHGKHLGFYSIPTEDNNCSKPNKIVIISDVILEPNRKFKTPVNFQNDVQRHETTKKCNSLEMLPEVIIKNQSKLSQTNTHGGAHKKNIFLKYECSPIFDKCESVQPELTSVSTLDDTNIQRSTESIAQTPFPEDSLISWDWSQLTDHVDENDIDESFLCSSSDITMSQVAKAALDKSPAVSLNDLSISFMDNDNGPVMCLPSEVSYIKRSEAFHANINTELPKELQILPPLRVETSATPIETPYANKDSNTCLTLLKQSLLMINNMFASNPCSDGDSSTMETQQNVDKKTIAQSLSYSFETRREGTSLVMQNSIKKKKPIKSDYSCLKGSSSKPPSKKRRRQTPQMKNSNDFNSEEEAIKIKRRRHSSFSRESDDERKKESEEEESEITSGEEDVKDNVHEGDWVAVNFISEKSVLHRFVGQIVKVFHSNFKVKFARKIDDSKFKWPDKLDVCSIERHQVVRKLTPPSFKSTTRRIGTFEFRKSLRKLKIDK